VEFWVFEPLIRQRLAWDLFQLPGGRVEHREASGQLAPTNLSNELRRPLGFLSTPLSQKRAQSTLMLPMTNYLYPSEHVNLHKIPDMPSSSTFVAYL
jgi:hypothetical protein